MTHTPNVEETPPAQNGRLGPTQHSLNGGPLFWGVHLNHLVQGWNSAGLDGIPACVFKAQPSNVVTENLILRNFPFLLHRMIFPLYPPCPALKGDFKLYLLYVAFPEASRPYVFSYHCLKSVT